MAQNNPRTSFTWQQTGLLNTRVALIPQARYPTLTEHSVAPAMFLKAPSMGYIKHRLVFKDRLFSQAVQN